MIGKNLRTESYTLEQIENEVKIPKWQRWVDQSLVNSLAKSLAKIGQLRPIIICVTKDGIKVLADGQHLRRAAALLGLYSIEAIVVDVENEAKAQEVFVTFNKVGKKLDLIDFIVSHSGIGNEDYEIFMSNVLGNPKSKDEAKDSFNIFSIKTLATILFNKDQNGIKLGDAELKENWKKMFELVQYIDQSYMLHPVIKDYREVGQSVLGTSAFWGIFDILDREENQPLLAMSKEDFLVLIVKFTSFIKEKAEDLEFKFTYQATKEQFISFLNQ